MQLYTYGYFIIRAANTCVTSDEASVLKSISQRTEMHNSLYFVMVNIYYVYFLLQN